MQIIQPIITGWLYWALAQTRRMLPLLSPCRHFVLSVYFERTGVNYFDSIGGRPRGYLQLFEVNLLSAALEHNGMMFARPASLLPHDPTANTAVQTKTTPPIRRFSAAPRRPRTEVRVRATPVGRNVPIHDQGGFWETNYALQLEEKIEATRRAQELWLEDATGQAQALRLEREEERLVHQTVYEQLRAEHQAQITEAAEKWREQQEEQFRRRQRIYEEQQIEQRARAREAAEAAERRREAEAEERRRRRIYEQQLEAERLLQAAAAAEARRRELEEAERRRRERERECLACTDTADMSTMAQVACTHWYCHECLQGKTDISTRDNWSLLDTQQAHLKGHSRSGYLSSAVDWTLPRTYYQTYLMLSFVIDIDYWLKRFPQQIPYTAAIEGVECFCPPHKIVGPI